MHYTLFTHDCVAAQNTTSIIKFAYDTTGLIGDESAYRREVADLIKRCQDNNLYLNINKTKELIVDPEEKGAALNTVYW